MIRTRGRIEELEAKVAALEVERGKLLTEKAQLSWKVEFADWVIVYLGESIGSAAQAILDAAAVYAEERMRIK